MILLFSGVIVFTDCGFIGVSFLVGFFKLPSYSHVISDVIVFIGHCHILRDTACVIVLMYYHLIDVSILVLLCLTIAVSLA